MHPILCNCYYKFYLHETVVTDAALNYITPLPIMDELDAKPNIEELGKAVDALSNGKAPGSDGIPPEVITSGNRAPPPPPLDLLHEVLCLCWKGGAVPHARDA